MEVVLSEIGEPRPPGSRPRWQAELDQAVCSPRELCRLLDLPAAVADQAERALGGFPMLVPAVYLARFKPGDPNDPLLLQVLPRLEECARVPGFEPDPLGEADSPHPGLLAKYQGRSLIVTTGACGVHCRFCFRRYFPYQGHGESFAADRWESALASIVADESLSEVILSGGDPLVLPDNALAGLAGRLARISHLSRLRIHTRLPVVVPARVTDELLAWLRGTRLVPLIVVHVNHPREIDGDVAAALGRLVDAGVPVLSQSVLLRQVNDSVEVLETLCRRLVDLRVMPYYLHQLDRVAGAAHFQVPEPEGRQIIAELRSRLPGYAVPRYVRETPGGSCKELLG